MNMMKDEDKPYSKYYGQGEPEWHCPSCGRPIPDEQEDLRCLYCETENDPPAVRIDSPFEQFHLRQLQRHIHRAIGRTVPFEQILGILKKLAESDDETSSEK